MEKKKKYIICLEILDHATFQCSWSNLSLNSKNRYVKKQSGVKRVKLHLMSRSGDLNRILEYCRRMTKTPWRLSSTCVIMYCQYYCQVLEPVSL